MYFNQELFKQHFFLAAKDLDLQTIVEESNVPLFSVMRFKEGIIENEVITDYYKICKWMGQDPLMYLINLSQIQPLGVLKVNSDFSEEEVEKFKEDWKKCATKGPKYFITSFNTDEPTVTEIRKPIVVVYIPNCSQDRLRKSGAVLSKLPLAKDYHTLVINSVDSTLNTKVKVEILSTEQLDDKKYKELVGLVKEQVQQGFTEAKLPIGW